MTVEYYNRMQELVDVILPDDSVHSDLFHIINLEEHFLSLKKTVAPYRQNFFEISYTAGLNDDCHVGNWRFNQHNDSLLFVSPGQINSWKLKSAEKPVESYMVYFKPELLGAGELSCEVFSTFRFFNLNSMPVYYLKTEQKEVFTDLFRRIHDEYSNFREGSIEIITSYLTILLNEAKRNLEPDFRVNGSLNRAEEITYQFENLIKSEYRKRLNLKDYAEKLHISPSYLREAVKQSTGKPANKLIQEYQILEAKSLLLQSNETVKHIALELGFDDPSNFVKFFKKQAGLTPLRYRENPK
ncbi:MAG: helix-turn-helix transcriptional regulator [Balneolaceae bacterium]|nr:helix-turn-helix transcriptional regulator [Balneolaceae bacterium]